jgi:hypothetical protein
MRKTRAVNTRTQHERLTQDILPDPAAGMAGPAGSQCLAIRVRVSRSRSWLSTQS